MLVQKTSIEEYTRQWLSEGYNNKQIEQKLSELGIEAGEIPRLLQEVSKLRNARKTAKGLIFILTGAALCLISCVLTIILPQSNTTIVLYGLTSIGIIIVFYGLMQIFG